MAASALSADTSSPGAGGAASKGPTMAKRSRAQRSRCGESARGLNKGSQKADANGIGMRSQRYGALRYRAISILCGDEASLALI